MAPFAPFESCVVCLRGDVTTGVVVRGPAEAASAVLRVLGVPAGQAEATIVAYCEWELGCEPGKVPNGDFDFGIRVCRDCAEGHHLFPGAAGTPGGRWPG